MRIHFYVRTGKTLSLKVLEGSKLLYSCSCKTIVKKKDFIVEKQLFKTDSIANGIINNLNSLNVPNITLEELKNKLVEAIGSYSKEVNKNDFFYVNRDSYEVKLFKKFLSQNSFRVINDFSLLNFFEYLKSLNRYKISTIISYVKIVNQLLKKYYSSISTRYNIIFPKMKMRIDDKVFISKDELELLFKYKDEFWVDMMKLAYFTGARCSDWAKIRPENIINNILVFKTQKTNVLLKLPLTDEMIGILNKYNNDISSLGLKTGTINYNIRKAAIETIKTKVEISIDGKKVVVSKAEYITSHSFRRSRITNLAIDGVPYDTIKFISGHKSIAMIEKYVKANADNYVETLRGIL